MEPIIIAVIGGPGVGKSFLVDKLAQYLKAETILENVEEIPEKTIENFKKDTGQLETIIWFRNKCIRDMEKALKLKSNGKIVVMDTYLISNELHITTMTSGFEQEILLEQAKFDRKYMPNPDVIVFLDASEDKIRELTLKRGRNFDTNEKFIQRNLSIQKAHKDYYNQNKNSLVYVNRDNLDFEKEEDVKKIVEKIEEFLKK
jgi:deoxyguanosine kinase